MKSLLIFVLFYVCNAQKFSEKDDMKIRADKLKHKKNLFELSEIDGYDEPYLNTGDILVGDRVIGGPTVDANRADWPWIVGVLETVSPNGQIYYGPGIAIHRNFVLCHAAFLDSIILYPNVIFVSNVDSIDQYKSPTAVIRTMYGENPIYIINPTGNTELSLGLAWVCPPFTDPRMIAPLPAPGQNYGAGTPMKILNYQPRLKSADTTVQPGHCTGHTSFIQDTTFCSDKNSPVKILPGDFRSHIAVINGKFAGYSIACCKAGSGDLFVDISKYFAWLGTSYKRLTF